MSKTLYIFIDESGNFDFTTKGARYFILTAVSTTEPSINREKFLQLKYDLLKSASCNEEFHATEDAQQVRDLVFQKIEKTGGFDVDSIIAQKNKANPSLYIRRDMTPSGSMVAGLERKTVRTEEKFYHLISQTLLRYIFLRYSKLNQIDEIVVVLGSIFNNTKQGYILKSLKQFLKQNFNKRFHIFFHPACSDINCQIADYCGWAISVSIARNEHRPISIIRPFLRSQFEIFKTGTNEYY